MSETTPQSEYIIERAIFTADRLPGTAIAPMDLSGSIAELVIYESIELPYLTGAVAIADSVKFRDAMGIKGTERLEIALLATKNSAPIIKTFMITGIDKNISVNERTDLITLTLLEEHAYLSGVMKMSESYTGKPENIINNILSSQLNKELSNEGNVNQQQRMKVNIPYWMPLQACDWLRDRMSYSYGSPFFLYSSLRDDKIHLDDLDNLMRKAAWNKSDPYTFSQSAHNQVPDQVGPDMKRSEFFHVKSYRAQKIESTFRLAQAGAIGSEFKTMDISSGSFLDNAKHDSRDTLNRLVQSVESNSDIDAAIGYDASLVLGNGKAIGELPSKVFSGVVTTGLFYENDGVTTISSYHEESKQQALYKSKIKSASLRTILMNNVITINVPGAPYIAAQQNIGVGSNLTLNYPAPTQSAESLASGEPSLDKNRSGKFLIYRTMHVFSDGKYNVQMDIVKLTNKIGGVQ
tara:strand:- start:3085 stop:4476 length:1392 start_codon:yes stop_codon:yes gene_type:complete